MHPLIEPQGFLAQFCEAASRITPPLTIQDESRVGKRHPTWPPRSRLSSSPWLPRSGIVLLPYAQNS